MAIQGRQQLLRKLAALPKVARKELGKALQVSADEIQGLQRRLAPVQSGALRDSIVQTKGKSRVAYSSVGAGSDEGDPDLTIRISAGNARVRYAHLVEFGTKSHVIRPKNRAVLRIGERFARTARHRGAKPKPFFYPGYRALKRRSKNRIARATRKAVRLAAGT